MSANDVRYGRQGGRRTKHEPAPLLLCEVCGRGMVSGGVRGVHATCLDQIGRTVDEQLTLWGDS